MAGSLIYEKLGERAFGWPGKMAAFGSIIMQNIGGRKKSHVDVFVYLSWMQFNANVNTTCACNIAKFKVLGIVNILLSTLSCSHVQLPLYRKVWAARSDPSILGIGRKLWVSLCVFFKINEDKLEKKKYGLWTNFHLLIVNGTWMGTTWWCLCQSESFCLCLCLKIWVRTHSTPVKVQFLFRLHNVHHMLCQLEVLILLIL